MQIRGFVTDNDQFHLRTLNSNTFLIHIIRISITSIALAFLISFILTSLTGCSVAEKKIPEYISKKYAGEEWIDSLISLMSLEEKTKLIHAKSSFATGGIERLGIPGWIMSDGPHGVRKEHGTDYVPDVGVDDSCTYLPVGVALASTWNVELAYDYGVVLGSEAKYRGKDVILGPGINIIRTPLNGRNFEYFSEDPHLTSQLAVKYIKGVQDQGISACAKHFVANNQEQNRTTVSVEMSERTLREIYLPAFKAAVHDADVHLVMGAYNKFRGQYCTHNEYLVNTILKGEWNFNGVFTSDWGSVHNTKEAIYNGTDVEMGTDIFMGTNPVYDDFFLGRNAVRLVEAGDADVRLIDDKVRRILRVMHKAKLSHNSEGAINTVDHQETAFKIAGEAIVLLKNESILPLDRSKKRTIAVIGANADRKHAASGGSSQVNAKYELTSLDGLRQLAGTKTDIITARGYDIVKDGKGNASLLKEAVKAAAGADIVIYVGGWIHGYSDAWEDNAFDSETLDKTSIMLPFGQNELISAIQKANANVIVVLYGGAATDMTPWVAGCKAIIQAWYPGMEGGKALAGIIFGDINPSGKLPMTFPKKLQDSPAHTLGEYPGGDVVNYNEGLLVGYRYFDTKKVEPLYPFGHGLSYTTFNFDNLVVEKKEKEVVVKLTVKNVGPVAGAEVVQVYVHDKVSRLERPDKELKAFQKVFLEFGETKEIELCLQENAFQYYDDSKRQWFLETGEFQILVGNSSKNIILTGEVSF